MSIIVDALASDTAIYDQLMGELLIDPAELSAEIRDELAALGRTRVLAEDGAVVTDEVAIEIQIDETPPVIEPIATAIAVITGS